MIKLMTGALALFVASPAIAHENGAHLHPHGFDAFPMVLGSLFIVALAWRLGKTRTVK